MKNLLKLAALAVFVFAATGCPSQAPVSPAPTVTITWTAPSTCGGASPACTYIVSRCTVATGATSCPSYTPLNQATPVASATYTDSAPPTGVSVLYVAQTVQSGLTGAASGPSNSGTPLAVPVYPGTPGAPNATENAMLAPPLLPSTQPALVVAGGLLDNIRLTARLTYSPVGQIATQGHFETRENSTWHTSEDRRASKLSSHARNLGLRWLYRL